MKNIFSFLLFILLLLVSFSLPAQLGEFIFSDNPSGPSLHIVSGSYLVLNELDTELGNPIVGGGTVKLTGARTIFYDSNNQLIPRLEIAQEPGHNVLVVDTSGVAEALIFSSPDAHLELQVTAFIVGQNATIQGYGPNNFVLTNSNASKGLIKQGVSLSPFEFPVGFDEQQYNPVVLQAEEGSLDLQVRALEHVLTNGGSGLPLGTEVVDASWEITAIFEPTPFFSILQAEWRGGDELPGFNRSICGLAYYDPASGWDLTATSFAPAFGNDPYARERTGLTDGGFFAVGGRALAPETSAEVDVLLGGSYTSGGLMSDVLRENALLPLSEPYSALGFSYAGFGAGASVDPVVFEVAGSDAIVDWLFVEIRDPADPATVVTSQPALLQRDGDIVDLDGVGPLRLAGLADGDYHIAVHHRNHLAIRTAAPLTFSSDGVEYSFLVDPEQALGGENAVLDLNDGFYGLVPGDVDQNGQVQNTDVTTLSQSFGSPGYLSADTDMNGQVQNIDLQLRLTPSLGRGRQF